MYYLSKVQIPSLRYPQITRTRLAEMILKIQDYQIAYMVAPAGYGKTTAAVQAVLQSKIPTAWLSLDHSDNGLNRFWRYMVLALAKVIPELEGKFKDHLTAATAMPTHEVIDTLIGVLQDKRQEYLLVLDDFSLIREPAVLNSLGTFIRYLPESLHLIIISRNEAELLKKRIGGAYQVKHIKAADLKFTKDELTGYCRLIEKSPSRDELDGLMYCTEGWPAGTAMILEAQVSGQDLLTPRRYYTGLCEVLGDYFWEEIAGVLPESELDFLIKTSVLNQLNPPLCDAVTGRADSAVLLHELAKKNILIEVISTDAGQYRYHKLFQHYLQQQLIQRESDAFSRLRSVAAKWLEDQGDLETAFEYIEDSDEPVRAAEFIEHNGWHLLTIGETTLLASWLGQISDSMVRESSMLCLLKAWISLLSRRDAELDHFLAQAESALSGISEARSEERRNSIRAEIMILRGLRELQQDTGQAIELILQAHQYGGNSILFARGADLAGGQVRLTNGLLGFYGSLSRLDEMMLGLYGQMEQVWGSFGYSSVLLGEVLYERNKLDDAYSALMQGLKEAVSSGCGWNITAAVVAISRLRRAKGDLSGALKIVDMGLDWLSKLEPSHRKYPLLAWKAVLSSEAGDPRPGMEWIGKVHLETRGVLEISKAFKYLMLVRLLLSRGELIACDVVLTDLLAQLKDQTLKGFLIEVYNLRAICSLRQKQQELALHYLALSLELGQSEGYIRSFADESVWMARLLELYCEKEERAARPDAERLEYARMLSRLAYEYSTCTGFSKCLLDSGEDEPEQKINPKVFLSPRELEVLQLMRQGMSNKEIAQELHISLQTAKFHCSNIYKKLEVVNRQNAVLKAVELGIV